jgi:uncharacterized protein (TIGR00255 family)
MTGYGKAVVAFKEKKINVEVKSLNSKQLDLNTRIAPLYREKEMEIRQMVAEAVIRGKVDMSVWIEKDTAVDATPINAALVENYFQQMKSISDKTGIPMPEDCFYTLLRMPDVLTKTETEILDEEEWLVVREAVKEALKNLHTPMFYMIGGPGDIAYANAQKDYERIADNIPVVMLNSKDGHSGTYYEKHGGNYAKAVVKWLDWQLKGRVGQSALFLDDEYLKMKFPEWQGVRKNF